MRKILLLALVFATSFTAFAQDFSNKGKEFWLCFPNHIPSPTAGAPTGRMSIWITSDQNSSGTITMTNGALNTTFTVAANGITQIDVPFGIAHIFNSESGTVIQKSIRIAVNPGQPAVVAYAQQYGNARSAATLLLPTSVLGKKYHAYSYTYVNTNATPGGGYPNQVSRSQFQVIATKPNTNVTITPRFNGVLQAAFTIALPNVGDMYQYQATSDITGTLIESIAGGSSGCSPIAVFSGSSAATFGVQGCTGGTSSYDPLFQQLYPVSSWGKNFGFIPLGDYSNGNPYRIMASEDNTTVSINGVVVATLNTGEIYPATYNTTPVVLNQPSSITADKPISVAQYAQRRDCSGTNNGDPDMVILNPIEQNIKDITVFTSTQQTITRQWINVLIQTVAAPSFKIDGLAPTTAFVPAANIPGYSYLTHLFNPSFSGARLLTADSGFNAILYGYQGGQFESYAYSAGTNVFDLSKELELETTYGIETSPSVCTNAPFKFKFYIPDSTVGTPSTPPVAIRFDSLRWDMSNPALIVPNNFPIMVYPPCPAPCTVTYDSITIRNGKRVTWYSLPATYYFNAAGNDTLLVTGYSSTNEGCGTDKLYDFAIVINDPPTASFNAVLPGCYMDSVRVAETTPQFPKTTYRQWWEFYDPVTNVTTVYTNAPPNPPAVIRNISHLFTTPGSIALGTAKRIRHASITTPGCLSDTIVQIIELPDIPNATIAGNTAVCLNSVASVPVTFTGTLGTAEYVFTYNINGGTPIVSAPSSGGTLTIPAPTNVAGTFVYNLVGVRNEVPAGTPCTRTITGQSITVQINPLPAAAITGATTVCLNGPQPPVTFTGSGGTAPYTFNYDINGTPQAPVVSNAAGVYTLNAPTNVAGPFNYTITQVTDASSTLCSSVTNVSTLITVNDLPDAAISGATAVCLNAAQPVITFTGSGGTAPYTFNYTINGTPQPALISNGVGVATVNAPTTVAGTFTYALVDVREGSPITCFRGGLTATTVVIVNPLPNAAIAGAITVCLNAPPPLVTFTGSGGTAPYTFNYNINGTPQAPVVSDAAGVFTLNAPTNVAGPFNYTITLVTDASSTLCSRVTNVSTLITVNDLPDAAISGASTVCLNATQPVITFTGSGGTAPYTFNYTINSVAQPALISNAAGVATVNAPTTVAGTFTYALVSVQEGSPITCIRTGLTGTTVITVNPLPDGVISGATAVCRNAPSPLVTFTGSGATAPYTFNYTINGTPQTPLVSNAAGVATIAAPTTVAGTFTYVLTSVQDASSTLCSQVIAGQQTVITINQLPVASFTASPIRCANQDIVFTNTSTPNAANATYDWVFNDPNATAGNPNTITTNTAAPNTTHFYLVPNPYTVTMVATNSNGCISDPVASVNFIVNDTPVADFDVPEVCINDVATVFADLSQPAAALGAPWYWNFGDPGSGPLNTSTTQNGTHLYPMPAIYRVYHGVTIPATGCVDTVWHDITINAADPVSNFTVSNSCSSDSVAIVNLSTVSFGNVTKLDIQWDFPGNPAIETINVPVFNAVYKHKYPTLPTTQNYTIRVTAYSGNVCFTSTTQIVTVYATPIVQFNNIPSTCYLVAPYQLTQGSEIGGVPGTGTYSGPGITNPNGTFNPQVAGIGTHTIRYTWTASNPGACIDTLDRTITVLDTAHAKFGVTLPSCEQVPTLFTNQSTAPASVNLASTVWDFGDATGPWTFAIAAPISHTYANPGTYTVRMHTLDNNTPTACLSTDTTAVITIDANHDIQWDAASGSENQPLCVNTSIVPIRYTLSGGATNVNFIPALPPGLTYTVGGTPLTLTISGAPTTPSNYSFDIETSGNTCVKDITTVTISVAPDHAIALRAGSDTAQSVCLNTPIDDIYYDLSGGATGVNISGLPAGVTYTVTGTELRIYGTPTSIPPGGPGYTITTTGNACLTDSRIGEIVVHGYPVPSFTVDKPGYCIPNAIVAFTNTTTPTPLSNHTYVWDFGDGSPTVTSVNPTHWYTSGTGPFTVRLSATSIAVPILNNGQPGCTSISDVPMTSIHPQPKADFVFSKPSVCIGDNVTITDNTDGKDGIVNQWNWDLGDGTTRVINPVTYTYGDTITYNITLYSVNTHGCNSDTITRPFTVYPYPKVNAGPDKFVLEGGSVELESTSFAREPQYTWTPDLYLTDTRIARPRVMNPKTDMTYRLTVTGRGGCATSDDVFVKLLKFPAIPNTFSPNNDGINDTWRIDFLNTYPENRVQIFTRTGKIVFESRGYNTPWDGTIKGKPLPFDTYYYIIEPGNGRDPITGYVTILK
jgi:gliding motility-associated-like protein